jgi:hypothetical protein
MKLWWALAAGAACAGVALGAGRAAAPGTSAAPYAQWKNGPPADASYFPIAVWLQDPKNARRYREAGINLYVGLWKGPTEAQLAALREAGMRVICAQNAVGLAHRDDPTIVGWMHDDEPDNAQPVVDPKTGERSWGPPVPPERVVADYHRLRAADPSRPILLNLGQGVANDDWKGRGPGAKREDYLTYVKGADIVSFDVYPVAGIDREDGANFLWYVPKGVDRLREWTGDRKPVWNCTECTGISTGKRGATPEQVRAEVWMSLIHGSRGLVYFVHEFKPKFREAALLEEPEMLAAVTAINREIRGLAPVLNAPTRRDRATVRSEAEAVPISLMVKERRGAIYLFAVGMRNAPTRGEFTVRGVADTATAEVLGENRTIPVRAGRFSDAFGPYDVRHYRIRESKR